MNKILCLAVVLAVLLMAGSSWAYKATNPCGVTCSGPGYPTFTYGNGPAVQHPEVVLIFWQDASSEQWTNNSNSPTMSQWIGLVKEVLNSAYMAGIGQYAGSGGYIGRPRFSGWAPIYTGNAPISGHNTSQYTSQDSIYIANTLIQNGRVPPPISYTYNGSTVTDDVLYVVIVPTSTAFPYSDPNCPSIVLAGFTWGCNVLATDLAGQKYVSITLTDHTDVLGHELVEGIVGRWRQTTINNCNNDPITDIGDYCYCPPNGEGTLDYAETLASYYSAADSACIIPETWGSLMLHNQPGESWSNPIGLSGWSQLYGGAGGVVAADDQNDVYFFTPPDSLYLYREGPFVIDPSEIAAGGGQVGVLAMDTAQAIQWTSTSTHGSSWNTLPNLPTTPPIVCDATTGALCPMPTPVTQLTMTNAGGGAVAVMDPIGEVWTWNWNTSKWVKVASACDDLTAYSGDLLCLTGTQRKLIYDYPASEFGTNGTTWSLVADSTVPIVHLVSSSDDVYGAYGHVIAGELSMEDSYGEHYIGSEFASFSVYYDGYFGGIQTQSPLQEWWVNPSDEFESWNETGPVGRLVSGGDVYATSCSNPPGMSSTCVTF